MRARVKGKQKEDAMEEAAGEALARMKPRKRKEVATKAVDDAVARLQAVLMQHHAQVQIRIEGIKIQGTQSTTVPTTQPTAPSTTQRTAARTAQPNIKQRTTWPTLQQANRETSSDTRCQQSGKRKRDENTHTAGPARSNVSACLMEG
jgi:hypothetical protein